MTFKLLGVHGFRFKKLAAVTHGVMRWGHGAPTLKRRRANAVPRLTTRAALMHKFICAGSQMCFEGGAGLLCAAESDLIQGSERRNCQMRTLTEAMGSLSLSFSLF